MIIWLASYPRSGNTFFRTTLNSQYGIKTCAVGDGAWLERFDGMAEWVGHIDRPRPLDQLVVAGGKWIVKTHDLPSDDSPAIYLVRDGRDASVSYARYICQIRRASRKMIDRVASVLGYDPHRSMLRRIIRGDVLFGGWGRHVELWTNRSGPTFVLRFEDLIKDPARHVIEALQAVGYDVNPADAANVPTFEELHAKWPQFFRKGQIGGWQQDMPQPLEEAFWERHGDVMEACGYRRAGVRI